MVSTVPLLILSDFSMRKLPHTAAEDLLEIVMRCYERFSTLLTSNRPVEKLSKLLGDVAAVSAMPTGCLTTAMCSSAVRETGTPRPRRQRANDYPFFYTLRDRYPGQTEFT